jgi:hypothetical protein
MSTLSDKLYLKHRHGPGCYSRPRQNFYQKPQPLQAVLLYVAGLAIVAWAVATWVLQS